MDAARSIVEVRDYKERFDLDGVLAEAVAAAARSDAADPYAAIAEHLRTKAPPRAAIPEPDAANTALRAFGALKHDAPSFEPFDPVATENTAVVLKEVKLPHAEQTHEVVYEPQTRCVFVSQMSNSVLVRIPVSSTSGLLLDDQDAWRVADEKAGLHNVSLSYKHPGCLWLSLQFANTLLLVEARTMRVRSVLRVPTHLPKVNDEPARRIGGPHAVRECPKTGDVWVALKGAVSCHPGAPEPDQAFTGTRRVREAVKRNCCSAAALRDHMAAMAAHGYDSPPPDGFAIWRVSVDAYDPEKPANGGTVYPCAASPPMMTVDAENHCWVALDQTPALLRIDAATGVKTQIPVSLPPSFTLQMTGPAIASGPDGGVWCTLLGGHAALARVDPATRKVAIYELGGPAWAKALRLIHLTFAVVAGRRTMYALASDLLDEDGVNAIVGVEFCKDWQTITGRRVLPLPTQDCSCHRVAVVQEGLGADDASIVVTEMASSKLLQVKIRHLTATTPVKMVSTVDGDQTLVTLEDLEEDAGCRC